MVQMKFGPVTLILGSKDMLFEKDNDEQLPIVKGPLELSALVSKKA